MPIECVKMSHQHTVPITMVSEREATYIDDEIAKLEHMGAVDKCSVIPGEYLSRIFTRSKEDGVSHRMIINLKPIKKMHRI